MAYNTYNRFAKPTNLVTSQGQRIYDLDPKASELWAIAGPEGLNPRTINPDALPKGVRWVTNEEWAEASARKNPHAVALGRRGGLAGKGKTSAKKAAAARRNGKKGGRPRVTGGQQ